MDEPEHAKGEGRVPLFRDPRVLVALIASVPPTIAAVTAIVLEIIRQH